VSLTGLIGTLATLVVVAVVWWPFRHMLAMRTEERFEAAHPRNPHGIIIGAEPIHVRGTRPGAILLLHGYNDTPPSVSSLAEALHEAGWTVRAPALPGHARTLQEFAQSGAADWIAAVRDELRQMLETHEAVAVAGMSMGGALAFLLAAEQPAVRAVVGVAPYIQRPRRLQHLLVLAQVAALGAKYVSGGGSRSVHDPVARERMIAYRHSTPRLLRELAAVNSAAQDALPRVRQPVLVVQSTEDNRIRAEAAAAAFDRIAAQDKTLLWVSGSGHVLTVNYGHALIEQEIVRWLEPRLA
jgi:carboxylesterase